MTPFINVGDRVRYLGGKGRFGHWPEGVWSEPRMEGTVTEYHPEEPTVEIRGERYPGIDAWAVVDYGNGRQYAISEAHEGQLWERVR